MSKPEAIHKLYEICKDINFDETDELVVNAEDSEEKKSIGVATDFSYNRNRKKL